MGREGERGRGERGDLERTRGHVEGQGGREEGGAGARDSVLGGIGGLFLSRNG